MTRQVARPPPPRATRIARPTSRVQIEPDRPYSVSLASRTASASSSNGSTDTTGPKISSRQCRSAGERASSTVGGYQNPGPSGRGAAEGHLGAVRRRTATAVPLRRPRSAAPSRPCPAPGPPPATPRTAGSSSSRNWSYTERWTRIRDRAQQSCPALSKTAYGAVAAAFSRSASAKTMLALLPPSSRVSRKKMGSSLGGTANETDHSARICTHIGLACSPDFMLSKPGLGRRRGADDPDQRDGAHAGHSCGPFLTGDLRTRCSGSPACGRSWRALALLLLPHSFGRARRPGAAPRRHGDRRHRRRSGDPQSGRDGRRARRADRLHAL